MTLYKFTGGTAAVASQVNTNINKSLTQSGMNLIRQAQDRSIEFNGIGGEFAEAYTDSNGQLNSINGTDTTAIYDLSDNTFKQGVSTTGSAEGSGDIGNTGSSVNTITMSLTMNVPGIVNQVIFYVGGGTPGTTTLTVNKNGTAIATKAQANSASSNNTITLSLSDYSGYLLPTDTVTVTLTSTQSNLDKDSAVSYSGTIFDVNSGDGWRTDTGDSIQCTEVQADASKVDIVHDLPSGTTSATISAAFATAMVGDWESGANIQYKLTNATEDSGFIDFNEIGSFTAFTSEATKLTIRLVPKSSSPTLGYPSVKGVAVFE